MVFFVEDSPRRTSFASESKIRRLVGRTTLAIKIIFLVLVFVLCALYARVEDQLRRTVKFFVNVCLHFVCSHRLHRDLHDFSVVSVNLLWIALKSLINN